MAEKVETISTPWRSILVPEFYDTYILDHNAEIDNAVFADALSATANIIGTTEQIADVPSFFTTTKNAPHTI